MLAEKFLTNGSLVNEEIASLYEKEGRFDEALKYVEESIVIAKLPVICISITKWPTAY